MQPLPAPRAMRPAAGPSESPTMPGPSHPNKPNKRPGPLEGYGSNVDAPFTDDMCGELADALAKLDELGADVMPLEMLDGFLAGVLAGPRSIAFDEYLPVILGADSLEDAPVFPDEREEQRFLELIRFRANNIAYALAQDDLKDLSDPRALSPILLDFEDEDAPPEAGEELPQRGELWAAGFLEAGDTWPEDWRLEHEEIEEPMDEILRPFIALSTPKADWPEGMQIAGESRDDWLAQAIWAVYDTYDFYRNEAPPLTRPPVRKAATPGRNDPCFCGSGKKYKNCHGAT